MFLSHLLALKILSLAPVSIFTCAGCQPYFVSDIIKEEREREAFYSVTLSVSEIVLLVEE